MESQKSYKVIIAGSRTNITYENVIHAIAHAPFNIKEIVSGTARGVDQFGEEFGKVNNIPIKKFPAEWERHGKSAGYKRNIEMAEYADALIAVWDSKSKGTKHMIDLMKRVGKEVYVMEVEYGKQ
ncbi:MAG: DUF2493 domain-containing protein [Desulfobacterales bacterium]|nr:DUF2493 domain-containing protein [Desulfobacterales bacterium]